MSKAGALASQGYSYQTLVAVQWAVRMLADPSIASLEIEATSLDPSGAPVVVDDIVVHRRDGTRVYCQCKKNQPDRRAWSLKDLEDELRKARDQLRRDPQGQVIFFSATPFGDLQRLVQAAAMFGDSPAFKAQLAPGLAAPFSSLSKTLGMVEASTIDWLRRVSFEETRGLADLPGARRSELGHYVTRPDVALDILYSRLHQAAGKFFKEREGSLSAGCNRVTRDDLVQVLAVAGLVYTPPRLEREILETFSIASAIGRYWRRNIGGKAIPRAALDQVLGLIESQPGTVLVTDGPGTGKTCLLLDLADRLESDPTKGVLYMQGREFADCTDPQALTDKGLPDDVVGQVARLAEHRHTVVIVDSLDVLSLNRQHGALGLFLSIMDRLGRLPRVTIVAACRSFDLKYDPHLAHRPWQHTVMIGLLDWEQEVSPFLIAWGVQPETLPPATRELLRIPRNLALFEAIANSGAVPPMASDLELAAHYLDIVVTRDPDLGEPALAALGELASRMLGERRLDLPSVRVDLPNATQKRLLSAGVLIETHGGSIAFGHQSLGDVLAVLAAERKGQTLLAFIQSHAAVPFLRPAVRAFFFHLRFRDPPGFRRHVRAVLDAATVAFHLKRLVAESLSEVVPTHEDWPLVRHLFEREPVLFERFLDVAQSEEWLDFFLPYWVPEVERRQDGRWALAFTWRLRVWMNHRPQVAVDWWRKVAGLPWVDSRRLVRGLVHDLDQFSKWDTPGIRELIEQLISLPRDTPDFLGRPLSAWIDATDSGDDLLWRYVIADVTPEAMQEYILRRKLHCEPHSFRRGDFLRDRMGRSEALLNLALEAIETWSLARRTDPEPVLGYRDRFLNDTSWERARTRDGHPHEDALNVLMDSVEAACLAHAAEDSPWWREHEPGLRTSREAALRYFALLAYRDYPSSNLPGIRAVLVDEGMLRDRFEHELGCIIHAGFYLLDDETQEACQRIILGLYAEEGGDVRAPPDWVLKHRRDFAARIPAWLRLPEAQALLDRCRRELGDPESALDRRATFGWVGAPVAVEAILGLSDKGLTQLLRHYAGFRGWEELGDRTVGGEELVGRELYVAASLDPDRFVTYLRQSWYSIPPVFRGRLLAGAAEHIDRRVGRLGADPSWAPKAMPEVVLLGRRLLDTLEATSWFWHARDEAARTLRACAGVIESTEDAGRLTFLLFGSVCAERPKPAEGESDRAIAGGGDDEEDERLITTAINSTRGVAAEAAMSLAIRWAKAGQPLPDLLPPLLTRFAADPHAAVRGAIVYALPPLQHYSPELGWALFDRALERPTPGLWQVAERCLYHGYRNRWPRIAGHLGRIETEGFPGAGQMWGRIAALGSLDGHLAQGELFGRLSALANEGAWVGTAQVYSENLTRPALWAACTDGLQAVLELGPRTSDMVRAVTNAFRDETGSVDIPLPLVRSFLEWLVEPQLPCDLHNLQEWLAALAARDPAGALPYAEAFTRLLSLRKCEIWEGASLGALLTALFREADDGDDRVFLDRVIRVQDALLAQHVRGLEDWLRAAERP